MRVAAFVLAAVALCSAQSTTYTEQPAPALPFVDRNACPGEGCLYGKWTATAPVEVIDTWKSKRKRIATLRPKDSVSGLTGLVVTYKPGLIHMDHDFPNEKLRSGDTILTYTYHGEGESTVWFDGRFYRDFDISFTRWPDGGGCHRSDCEGTYVDLGKKTWWAKVKLQSGAIGWVNMDKSEFDGTCSLVPPRDGQH